MECLDNFIGISNRCAGTPASRSGMYIEDFEGFSVKSLSLIEGGKYLTVQAMIDSKLRVVGQKISEYIGGLVGDIYIENSVDALIGKNFDDDYFDQEDGTPGLLIEKYPTALSYIFIPRFYFKSHVAVSGLVITVSDGVTSETFTVDAAADEEIVIECSFSTHQRAVTITYSSTDGPSDLGVAPFTSDISLFHTFDFHVTPGCDKCNTCGHRYLRVRGLDFSGAEKSVYYGIRADIELVCDREKMVCLIAPNNKLLVFYYLAVEILAEYIASDRMNFLAINSKDWAKEKRAETEARILDLWGIHGPGIRNLLLNSEKKCFQCTGYRYVESIP